MRGEIYFYRDMAKKYPDDQEVRYRLKQAEEEAFLLHLDPETAQRVRFARASCLGGQFRVLRDRTPPIYMCGEYEVCIPGTTAAAACGGRRNGYNGRGN